MKEATIKININTKNAIGSIDELNNEFNGTLQTISDLRIASKALSEELESTPVGTAKFQELQQALIDVNGQIKNYELSIEALDNEQLASEIRSVVGGVMDLAGGLTLLGVSSSSMEVIAQKFAKIEGISRAATGAMDIYNSGTKVMNTVLASSAAAQETLAVATAASGNASLGASIKFRALTAAMLANPFIAIATAIAAVVTAIILFSDEEESAADKSDKLTDSLNKQNIALEQNTKLSEYNARRSKKYSDLYYEKHFNDIEKEIALLETVTNKTAQQNKELEKLYEERAISKKEQLVQEEMDEKLSLTNEKNSLDEKMDNERIYMNSLIKLKKDADEEELKDLTKKINESIIKQEDYKLRVGEINSLMVVDIAGRETNTTLLEREYATKREKIAQDEEIRKEKIRQDAISKEREDNIKRFNDLRERNEKATDEQEKIRINSLLKSESEIENLIKEVEDKKIDLIENANKEQINLNEERYKKGLISLKTFQLNYEKIITDGYVNLTQTEKDYFNSFVDFQTRKIDNIKNNLNNEKTITIGETNSILAETELLKIKYAKQSELLDAEKITNETVKTQKILEINQRYLSNESNAIKIAKKKQIDLLKAQRDIDLSDTEKTIEEKEKILAEYEQNVLKIENEASLAIVDANANTILTLNEKWDMFFQDMSSWITALSGPINQISEIVTTVFDQLNAEAQANIDKRYDYSVAMTNKLYGEQLISREEYQNKLKEIEQQKREDEKEEARKAFKQQKALQITNATMQGAQAVLAAYSSGAAVPIIGPVTTGPLFAGIAGALAATQVGLIASQKFTASRGGKVPGYGSKVDSVDALLAPGEMVINSESSQNPLFAPILSAINQAGGGIPLAPSEGLLQPQKTNNLVYVQNQSSQNIKAYVVESEITGSQNRMNKLRNNSKF